MSASSSSSSVPPRPLFVYGTIFLWISLSAAVILINKYILSYGGFPYPIALTMLHMVFCSALSTILLKLGVCDAPVMTWKEYMTTIVPIALLFSGTLWFGNAAYLYLSVSFIQMIKAMMPVTVYSAGLAMGLESFSRTTALNMLVVAGGTCLASHGELAFNLIGFLFQSASIVTESARLVLIQILLHRRGVKLNPVTTLYFISPPCFVFLTIPFASLELGPILQKSGLAIQPSWLLLSAASAFALNLAVFLLIGKTSALTMNIGGVVKDWLLIGLSILLFKSSVTTTQLVGYSIAFLGVAYYNHTKILAAAAPAPPLSDAEKQPLLTVDLQPSSKEQRT